MVKVSVLLRPAYMLDEWTKSDRDFMIRLNDDVDLIKYPFPSAINKYNEKPIILLKFTYHDSHIMIIFILFPKINLLLWEELQRVVEYSSSNFFNMFPFAILMGDDHMTKKVNKDLYDSMCSELGILITYGDNLSSFQDINSLLGNKINESYHRYTYPDQFPHVNIIDKFYNERSFIYEHKCVHIRMTEVKIENYECFHINVIITIDEDVNPDGENTEDEIFSTYNMFKESVDLPNGRDSFIEHVSEEIKQSGDFIKGLNELFDAYENVSCGALKLPMVII